MATSLQSMWRPLGGVWGSDELNQIFRFGKRKHLLFRCYRLHFGGSNYFSVGIWNQAMANMLAMDMETERFCRDCICCWLWSDLSWMKWSRGWGTITAKPDAGTMTYCWFAHGCIDCNLASRWYWHLWGKFALWLEQEWWLPWSLFLNKWFCALFMRRLARIYNRWICAGQIQYVDVNGKKAMYMAESRLPELAAGSVRIAIVRRG